MKQKFKRGSIVKVYEVLEESMSHFESDFIGVVEYSYMQKYGPGTFNDDDDSPNEYRLIVLDNDGKAVNSISWYYDYQLALVNDDIALGLSIIEQYRFGNNDDTLNNVRDFLRKELGTQ